MHAHACGVHVCLCIRWNGEVVGFSTNITIGMCSAENPLLE